MKSRSPRSSGEPEPSRRQLALERNRGLIAAVPVSELVDIRIDVPTVAMRVLGAVRGWTHLRERIVAMVASQAPFAASSSLGWCSEWPNADPLEVLASIAEATLQAHAEYVTAVPATGQLAATFKRATELRKQLVVDARALEQRQLLPLGSLRGLSRRKGYRNVAIDLMALVNLFQTHWHKVRAKCAITDEELVTADVLAQTLFAEGYERWERATHREDATLLRARAFTLLLRAYDDLRSCIKYLEPVAHKELAPSLYKGRGPRAARRNAPADPEQLDMLPAQPVEPLGIP